MRLAGILVTALISLSLLVGCGAGTHRPRSHRALHAGVCAFSVWRGTHDARTHHYGFAAFQAYLAAHHCRRALHRG